MKKIFKLEGLDCAHCATKIENAIKKIDGIELAEVNFMTTKMIIEFDDTKIDDITNKVVNVIKKIEPNILLRKV